TAKVPLPPLINASLTDFQMNLNKNTWTLTYSATQICAFKGSTVEINCNYRYPSRINGQQTKVEQTVWFTKGKIKDPVDLKTDSDYSGRVQYDCGQNDCTLRITDLRESDSAEYKFRFTTNQPGGKYTGSPGVTLSDLSEDTQYSGRVEVLHTDRRSTLRIRDLTETDSAQYRFIFRTRNFEWGSSYPGTTLTVTAVQLQVIRIITVQQSYTEAELKCHSSCSPAGRLSYVWFRNGGKVTNKESSYEGRFDPGEKIFCALEGHEDCGSPPVPSVSVNPPGEIMEGSLVTLTCSNDTNSAANISWYKDNLPLWNREAQLVFSSIRSSDSGQYHCTAENELGRRTSGNISIHVEYPPKNISVSVSPSAEMVEGSSVNLSCSSDANPAANITWYKEGEDSPKASGQIFTITDLRPEHSGNYYCEVQNTRGRRRSTLYLNVRTGEFPFHTF
uniref:B-cell receptor CD22 n=1 Tax=Echeneis naucrates TaxID=173247 RepID=A0A665VTW5_ECHNA